MSYCDRCDRFFPHYRALEQHKGDSLAHWPCNGCNLDFPSHQTLKQHYVDSSSHHYCKDCDHHFQNENNLRQHMNSKVHQPARFRCPGSGCAQCFISAGALALHIESGKCPSGMTRETLNRLVVRADTNHYITNPSRLLTGPLGRSEPPAPVSMWATERSWNGSAFECFLCGSTYRLLAHLNQHLKSPSHQAKIYRCPNSDCRTEFKTLSGLCQHVEGGSCGVRRFRQVRDTMDSLTRGFNMLTV